MEALDPDIWYRALQTRDARFDGRLFVGVTSSISIGQTMMGTLVLMQTPTAALTSSTSNATAAQFYDGSHCGEDPMPSVPEPISYSIECGFSDFNGAFGLKSSTSS